MDTPELSRPDLFAHREALRLPASKVVEKAVKIVGRKLTAYIGGVKDARAVDRWIADGEIYGDAKSRFRFAFQVARTLSEHDSPAVVQALLTGVNPDLVSSPQRREDGFTSWRQCRSDLRPAQAEPVPRSAAAPLGNRVPLSLMRENEIDEVAPAIMSAARAFLAGG